MITNCRLYSNISQILLLYKTWGYYNKFDATKSLGACYWSCWCIKIPQREYIGHGLKLITFYVQKHIAALAMCHIPPLAHDKPLGAPASVKPVYWVMIDGISMHTDWTVDVFDTALMWASNVGHGDVMKTVEQRVDFPMLWDRVHVMHLVDTRYTR